MNEIATEVDQLIEAVKQSKTFQEYDKQGILSTKMQSLSSALTNIVRKYSAYRTAVMTTIFMLR